MTQILQDRQISYIGIDELKDEIIVFTKKKLRSGDVKALSQAVVTIGAAD